jgi:N,N'-diacetyllegionaminate synthase
MGRLWEQQVASCVVHPHSVPGSGDSFAARLRGDGPALVIAEAGVNHNGDLTLAHRLVDAAADAGADLIKFQTFAPEMVLAADAPAADYQKETVGATQQIDFIRGLVLPDAAWRALADHAHERGIAFFSTAFDARSVEFIRELDPPVWKVPSGEITNLPFIRLLASLGRPLLISTGMSTLAEVGAALDAASAAPTTTLFHCVSSYPTPVDQANLRAITTLREEFDVPVGWSDHTLGSLTAVVAVALGATVFEKHLTLDRDLPGPDHRASADPTQMAGYVEAIRSAEAALGDGHKVVMPAELGVRAVARRSWHAGRDLQEGDTIAGGDVVALRPGDGIAPSVDLIGRRMARSVRRGTKLVWEDLAGDSEAP